ncbi:MAG: hypothetical protein JWM57_1727 [Phycisphaerales bacterium]|nr:hypothetical protein [Phycisphaerales bacterium]
MGKRAAGKQSKSKDLSKQNSNLESLEQRQLYASDLGINVNSVNASNYKAIVETLVASGTKGVRLWYGFGDYSNRTLLPVTTYAQKFHNDGFTVTLSVNPSKGRTGTADETRGLFEFLATQPELKDSVDIWELGNEPDSQKYWRGNLNTFVTDFVAPAARVLHNQGEKVASGGVSWNPKDVKTMVDAGLLNSVDYVGIHPYARTIGGLKNTIAELKTYVGGTPLIATEWNIRGFEGSSDKTGWAAGVAAMWPIIRENFAVSHYFVTTVMDSLAGPAGILQANGRANEPFYSTYMHLQDDVATDGGTTDGGTTDGGTTDGGSTGGTTTTPTGGTTDGSTGGETQTGGVKPAPGTSTDGDPDPTSTGSGGTQSGGTTKPTTGGSSTDGETDAGDGAGSQGVDPTTPTKTPSKGTHSSRPTTPSKPSRPTTGTVTEPTTPAAPPVVVVPPAITSFSLLNASRDRVVKQYGVLSGVNTIDLAAAGTSFLSILASANKKTGSVVWTIDGNAIIDNDGTYTLYGEKSGDLVGSIFEAGKNYVLTAQPFSGENGTGAAGQMATISINVTNSAAGNAVAGQDAAEIEARRRLEARQNRIESGVGVIADL